MTSTPNMKCFPLPPPLLYGTAWKKEKTTDFVKKALICGFKGIDTACQPKHYDEGGVGQALKWAWNQGIHRESLFIQTKFTPITGQDPARVPYDPQATIDQQVRQSMHVSLQNLNVTYVDALLMHSPFSRHEQTMEAWQAMQALQAQGLVLRLGISNCYDLEVLKKIFNNAFIKPSLLQNRFYSDTHYDTPLRLWCKDHEIHYEGFWTLTANPHILRDVSLTEIAARHGISVEQLFFRFLTQQSVIPLVGTCSEKHMREALAIFGFSLTDKEIDSINDLLT